MGKVTLDAATRAKLHGLGQQLELYDEQGNLIGYCLPPAVYRSLADRGGGWGPFTEEEVNAAFRQTGPGRPLEDILADLREQ